ncbi:hypothetical protein HDZ31DRAFT_60136 [Schizophyllum fasciatum]
MSDSQPPALPRFDADLQLGPVFVGCVLAGVLYGVACNQTYSYHRGRFQDPWPVRAFVSTLLVLESTHLVLVIRSCYYYMVTTYAKHEGEVSPVWSILTVMLVEAVMNLSIRTFFCRRVWLMARPRNRLLAWALVLCIETVSLLAFACNVALCARAYSASNSVFVEFQGTWFRPIAFLLYASLGCGVVADAFIATSMCVLLLRSRTGTTHTNSVIETLVLYAIATGLCMSMCEIACFITYAVRKSDLIFVGIYFTLSTLLLNSLLASLNARTTFRNREGNRTSCSALMMLNTLPPSAQSSADTHALFARKTGAGLCEEPEEAVLAEESHTKRVQGWMSWATPRRADVNVQPKTYSQGDRVEYRPVGGESDNVSHSTGEIVSVEGSGEDVKYTIRNDNTGKETTYQPKNIVGHAK